MGRNSHVFDSHKDDNCHVVYSMFLCITMSRGLLFSMVCVLQKIDVHGQDNLLFRRKTVYRKADRLKFCVLLVSIVHFANW